MDSVWVGLKQGSIELGAGAEGYSRQRATIRHVAGSAINANRLAWDAKNDWGVVHKIAWYDLERGGNELIEFQVESHTDMNAGSTLMVEVGDLEAVCQYRAENPPKSVLN